MPICDHRNIKGHAVRAAYLLSGATDVAGETRRPGTSEDDRAASGRTRPGATCTLPAASAQAPRTKASPHDYDLPNLTAYQETCASVALAQWNHRLALLYGDCALRRRLRALALQRRSGRGFAGWEAVLLCQSAGKQGHHHRSPWFGCACCPPNVARTLASLGRLCLCGRRRLALGEPLHPGDGLGNRERHAR